MGIAREVAEDMGSTAPRSVRVKLTRILAL